MHRFKKSRLKGWRKMVIIIIVIVIKKKEREKGPDSWRTTKPRCNRE
jgi:hypothetical protein